MDSGASFSGSSLSVKLRPKGILESFAVSSEVGRKEKLGDLGRAGMR